MFPLREEFDNIIQSIEMDDNEFDNLIFTDWPNRSILRN